MTNFLNTCYSHISGENTIKLWWKWTFGHWRTCVFGHIFSRLQPCVFYICMKISHLHHPACSCCRCCSSFRYFLYPQKCIYIFIYINIYKYIGLQIDLERVQKITATPATIAIERQLILYTDSSIFRACLFSCLFWILIWNTHDFFVHLHCRKEKAQSRPLRIKIVSIKYKNCAH